MTRSEPEKRGKMPGKTPYPAVASQLTVSFEAITDDLRIVVEAWPTLSDDTKTELMSLIRRGGSQVN